MVLLQSSHDIFQDARSLFEGFVEFLLLALDYPRNVFPSLLNVRIRLLHDVADNGDEFVQEAFLDAQLRAVADCAP